MGIRRCILGVLGCSRPPQPPTTTHLRGGPPQTQGGSVSWMLNDDGHAAALSRSSVKPPLHTLDHSLPAPKWREGWAISLIAILWLFRVCFPRPRSNLHHPATDELGLSVCSAAHASQHEQQPQRKPGFFLFRKTHEEMRTPKARGSPPVGMAALCTASKSALTALKVPVAASSPLRLSPIYHQNIGKVR